MLYQFCTRAHRSSDHSGRSTTSHIVLNLWSPFWGISRKMQDWFVTTPQQVSLNIVKRRQNRLKITLVPDGVWCCKDFFLTDLAGRDSVYLCDIYWYFSPCSSHLGEIWRGIFQRLRFGRLGKSSIWRPNYRFLLPPHWHILSICYHFGVSYLTATRFHPIVRLIQMRWQLQHEKLLFRRVAKVVW